MKKGDKLICIFNKYCESVLVIGSVYVIDKLDLIEPEYYITGPSIGSARHRGLFFSKSGIKVYFISLKEHRKRKLERLNKI